MNDGDAAYVMWHAALALTLSFYYTDVVDLCCEGCSGRSMCVGPCTHACVHVRYTCMCVHALYAPTVTAAGSAPLLCHHGIHTLICAEIYCVPFVSEYLTIVCIAGCLIGRVGTLLPMVPSCTHDLQHCFVSACMLVGV